MNNTNVTTRSDTLPMARSAGDSGTEPPRFLSREEYQDLLAQLHRWGVMSTVKLSSTWRSDVRWARNRITMAGDWRDVSIGTGHGNVQIATNQRDQTSLRGMVTWAEERRQQFQGGSVWAQYFYPKQETQTFPSTHVWSQATYEQTQDTRLTIAQQLIAGAEASGMLSAGYLSVEAQGYVIELSDARVEYVPMTTTQCSLTVRDPAGNGSGWAGRSSYDWTRIGAEQLAAVALDKCLKSRNAVRVEPGRYTLIMEPQATYDLIKVLFHHLGGLYEYLDFRKNLQMKGYPFHDPRKTKVPVSQYAAPVELGATQMGQRVFDPRITLRWDPLDPDLGRVPFTVGEDGEVYPVQPVKWVTNGVLTALGYPAGISGGFVGYGDRLDINGVAGVGSSFRMEGGTTTIDEMIATTKRGLLATRFWGMQVTWAPSMLCTGTTRDGLWLIENGKISKAVKNLRWTESPMFAFNQVEQIGAPVPVFNPGLPVMTPPVKVRDFSFTALEDAV